MTAIAVTAYSITLTTLAIARYMRLWRRQSDLAMTQENFETIKGALNMDTIIKNLICFSHLRWTFVFQRPQHLMSRFARHSRVHFFEEPVYENQSPELRRSICPRTGVHVITPVLPVGTSPGQIVMLQRQMLESMLVDDDIHDFIAWYYTPMALQFTNAIPSSLTIYDCMDELSAFAGAPPTMRANEQLLFERADLVFTGGASLFAAKRKNHSSVHLFPSSVDVTHFSRARSLTGELADQTNIPHPRIGYIGVIDERLDTTLLIRIAEMNPSWHFVMVGPVVKIDPKTLPKCTNIHYLGMKAYDDLPDYLGSWDVAMLPFSLNESTRFISPTKTPEYLAAGLPVVSTPIADVIAPYGDLGLVSIAAGAERFTEAIAHALKHGRTRSWSKQVDAFLDTLSWDRTWQKMAELINQRQTTKDSLLTGVPLSTTQGAWIPAMGLEKSNV
jgi:glycosyltransferase involved in cell wall biosynthesis